MKRMHSSLVTAVMASALSLAALLPAAGGENKIGFWDSQRKGANYFNTQPEQIWFEDAHQLGLQWVRLAYDKWQGKQKDFLLGNADHFTGLVPEDLARLRQALDWAQAHGIKVVVAPLSLPGSRWSQHNGDKPDLRLWQDKIWWEQASRFWQELAAALKDHPAVVGYNLLNEPLPEMGTGLQEDSEADKYQSWYARYKGTSHDMPALYQQIVTAIRKVDTTTPIMLDAGWYARPAAFVYWPRLADDKLLYAFHMYEPYEFTNRLNFKAAKPFSYPGKISYAGRLMDWNAAQLASYISPFFSWARQQGIPPTRQVAAEFGCYRRNPGCQNYLSDLVKLFNQQRIHWGFYSFREDEWDGYDYELGSGPLPQAYWQAHEHGGVIPRRDNPLFSVLRSEFTQP